MALTGLQQIIVEAEQMRPDNQRASGSIPPLAHDDQVLDLIIRLAREVDDVLRTATR